MYRAQKQVLKSKAQSKSDCIFFFFVCVVFQRERGFIQLGFESGFERGFERGFAGLGFNGGREEGIKRGFERGLFELGFERGLVKKKKGFKRDS